MGHIRILAAALLAASALPLAACQNRDTAALTGDALTTASTSQPSFRGTAELGKKWQANPKDIATGIAYADGLEKLSQTDQQIAVLQTLAAQNPGDARVQSIYGKKLIGAGRTGEAIPVLEPVAAKTGDWRILSALGSAYDQNGRYADARGQYQRALALQPNEISVTNNMAMSYALEGNLKQAESVLRQAMSAPGGKDAQKIRQNLALVVGLQGRFDEARQIASEDLPPEQVEENMAYLQKMLSQPNTWQKLSGG
jgi:Flp pilus assembly protein TadD